MPNQLLTDLLQANAVTLALIFAITIGIVLILSLRAVQPLVKICVELSTKFSQQNELLNQAIERSNNVGEQLALNLQQYSEKTAQHMSGMDVQAKTLEQNQYQIEKNRMAVTDLQQILSRIVENMPQQLQAQLDPVGEQLDVVTSHLQTIFARLSTRIETVNQELSRLSEEVMVMRKLVKENQKEQPEMMEESHE